MLQSTYNFILWIFLITISLLVNYRSLLNCRFALGLFLEIGETKYGTLQLCHKLVFDLKICIKLKIEVDIFIMNMDGNFII